MIATYRKKPVDIQAAKFTDNESAEGILKWIGSPPVRLLISPDTGECYGIEIDTLEGVMKASLGDWIIRGVQGEFYPCKPDIFDSTYEHVDV